MAIVFVHGITVRRDRFERLVADVREGCAGAGSALDVNGCYWGDLGRSAGYTGASIPGFAAGTRGLGGVASGSRDAGLLAVLLEDPLAELSDLRDVEEFTLGGVGFRPVSDNVVQRNEALRSAEEPVLKRIVQQASVFTRSDVSRQAEPIRDLLHGVFQEAARAERTLDAVALCPPISRAIIAGLYQALGGDDALAGEFRWNKAVELVEPVLEAELGGQRGMMRNAAATSLTLALRHGLRNRIMPQLTLFLGDVFAWFRNRDAILDRVDEAVRVARQDGPLVLIGHSLGGVIAFEYSLQADRDVELLATVGSQVGLFGELGVLHGVAPTAEGKLSPPTRVGIWRNFYDPDDALSFCAEPIFPGVSDIEIDTRAPFPVSHSEYWNLPGTYAGLLAGVRA
jgi:pimeloyl-ACP methyl ester carboxylesterase